MDTYSQLEELPPYIRADGVDGENARSGHEARHIEHRKLCQGGLQVQSGEQKGDFFRDRMRWTDGACGGCGEGEWY